MRTLAVVGVVLYHLNLPIFGGLLGVTIFFVLSGYLITSLLIGEYNRTSTINLPQFWLRRVKRLFPAIVLVIATTATLCTFFNHELLTKMRPDIISCLFFFNNWWQIFHNVSYFDALGAPSPLTIFWSLAIEEQFYLLWPGIMLLLLRFNVPKKVVIGFISVLICASALEMAFMYSPIEDPSRVYYGTDTRAFSLLMGALFAHLWPSSRLGTGEDFDLSADGEKKLDIGGMVCLAGLIIMMIFADGLSPFLYRGGMFLCSVLTSVLICVIVHPKSQLSRLFSLKPLVWLGQRSYGIYLWHYPIILLLIDRNIAHSAPFWLILLACVLIVAVSAVSFKYVEDPIRKGALTFWWKKANESVSRSATHFKDEQDDRSPERVRHTQAHSSHNSIADGVKEKLRFFFTTHPIQMSTCTLLCMVALLGCAFVPPTSSVETVEKLKELSANQSNVIDEAKQSAENGDNAGTSTDNQNSDSSAETSASEPTFKPYSVLLIGDSVSLMAKDAFIEAFPGGHLDSKVSRQFGEAMSIYDYYDSYYLIGDTVVFSLGTNGRIKESYVDDMMARVGKDKRVFWVNTRSNTAWFGEVNDILAAACEKYDNAYLIDWCGYTADKGDIFDGDGTHIKYKETGKFVNLIKTAIEQNGGLPYEPTPEEVQARNEALAKMD